MASGQVVPRGIEVLLRKAAVDPEFRERLLADRDRAAGGIGIELLAAERAVLGSIPRAQLVDMIDRTEVPPEQARIFRFGAAAAMLAAVAGLTLIAGCPACTGSRPPEPRPSDVIEAPEEPSADGSGDDAAGRKEPDGKAPLPGETAPAPDQGEGGR